MNLFECIFTKEDFFEIVVVSVLLYGCSTQNLTKGFAKKIDGNHNNIVYTAGTSDSVKDPYATIFLRKKLSFEERNQMHINYK